MKYSPFFQELVGCANKDEVFQYLMENLTDSITYWDYFVNWVKVKGNVRSWELDLNALNCMIGKADIKATFKWLLQERPTIISLIPVLLACRDRKFKILIDFTSGNLEHEIFDFTKRQSLTDEEIEQAYRFVKETGLLQIFKQKDIRSVPDYIFGVEVGLDTNGRKNRGGKAMESLIENLVRPICEIHGFKFMSQATVGKLRKQWGKSVQVDKTRRCFDFAILNNEVLYLIETNYYKGGGSKLKATAGEYKTLHDLVTSSGVRFIWITDGLGWRSTERPLEETFQYIDYTLNIKMVTQGILERILVEKV